MGNTDGDGCEASVLAQIGGQFLLGVVSGLAQSNNKGVSCS